MRDHRTNLRASKLEWQGGLGERLHRCAVGCFRIYDPDAITNSLSLSSSITDKGLFFTVS